MKALDIRGTTLNPNPVVVPQVTKHKTVYHTSASLPATLPHWDNPLWHLWDRKVKHVTGQFLLYIQKQQQYTELC